MRLETPTDGRVHFEGADMAHASKSELFRLRRDVQAIFQDPYSSLNPRMTVGEIVREPLLVHRIGTKTQQVEKVRALLETVWSPAICSTVIRTFSLLKRQRTYRACVAPSSSSSPIASSALDVSVASAS